jgi:ribosomal protein L32
MPFVDTFDYPTTRKRTSDSYVKFSPDHRVVLRILDPRAKLVWKHWIPEANAGRGMMANCPNTQASRPCPIEKSLVGLAKDDPKLMERRAKKRYIANVLDRTPYTVCPSCNESTPKGKACSGCGTALKSNLDYAPLNKVKLLEGGPRLFAQDLLAVETSMKEDHPEKEITDYDITFTTSGTGRERRIAVMPQAPVDLTDSDLADSETGESQKQFDLELLAEPTSIEEIEAMLRGATLDEINAIRGVN